MNIVVHVPHLNSFLLSSNSMFATTSSNQQIGMEQWVVHVPIRKRSEIKYWILETFILVTFIAKLGGQNREKRLP